MSAQGAILLVEDNEDDLFLMRCGLEEAAISWAIQHVGNLPEATRYLVGDGIYENRQAYPLPKVVFLDLHLAAASGFELLTWMRADERFRGIVVIMFSSSASNVDIARAYRLGANSYIAKPATPEQLVETMVNFRKYWLETNLFPTG